MTWRCHCRCLPRKGLRSREGDASHAPASQSSHMRTWLDERVRSRLRSEPCRMPVAISRRKHPALSILRSLSSAFLELRPASHPHEPSCLPYRRYCCHRHGHMFNLKQSCDSDGWDSVALLIARYLYCGNHRLRNECDQGGSCPGHNLSQCAVQSDFSLTVMR